MVSKRGSEIVTLGGVRWPAGRLAAGLADGDYTLGIRPHHITAEARPGSEPIEGRVLVTEISGSESVIHFDVARRHLGVAVARHPRRCRSAPPRASARRPFATASCSAPTAD